MNFADMYERQRSFQEEVGDVGLPEPERLREIEHLALLQHGETADMLKELGVETHRPFQGPNWGNGLYEWVDQFKYLLAQAVVAGWTAGEITLAFEDKSTLVEERWRREQAELMAVPCVVFDIDGVIAEYREMSDEEMAGGGFLGLNPVPEAIDVLRRLKSSGHNVVLVTSRKVHRWRRIAVETEMWLRTHKVPFDRLEFAYDKSVSVNGLAIRFVVEDSPKHALDYAQAGYLVYLKDGAEGMHDLITPFVSFAEIVDVERLDW